MPYTCALDVQDAFPDGIPSSAVGGILGITEQAVQEEIHKRHVRAGFAIIRKLRSDDDDLDTFDVDHALELVRRMRDGDW